MTVAVGNKYSASQSCTTMYRNLRLDLYCWIQITVTLCFLQSKTFVTVKLALGVRCRESCCIKVSWSCFEIKHIRILNYVAWPTTKTSCAAMTAVLSVTQLCFQAQAASRCCMRVQKFALVGAVWTSALTKSNERSLQMTTLLLHSQTKFIQAHKHISLLAVRCTSTMCCCSCILFTLCFLYC